MISKTPGAGLTPRRPALPLRNETLRHLSEGVLVPTYDRGALRPGVVHISVGSFHRSHQAVYFDDLAQRGERHWGIVGVGWRRPELGDALSHQDRLYTVVARGAGKDEARVVGSMTRYLFAPRDAEATLEALTDERTALVTLTITADAYEASSGGQPYRAPFTPAPDGSRAPSRALGYLADALDRRRLAGRAPFTVLSCDNLPDNGARARSALVSFARLRDERLADWIDQHVEFPNSMVDRITPKTTETDREAVSRDFGILDKCPVITEPFSQWILEDRFCNRRPPLEEVGVQFVEHVAPYALMKTRLLNASHCAIGFLGSLAGLRRADEVMREPVFSAYIKQFMDQEVTPLLPPVPDVHLPSYKRALLDRLANHKLGDELERLCRAGSSKVQSHVVPSIVQARKCGGEHRLLTVALAGWFRYLRATDERGRQISLHDPLATSLRATALAGGTDPRPLLSKRALFGELSHDTGFAASLEQALVSLERKGVRATLATCVTAAESVAA